MKELERNEASISTYPLGLLREQLKTKKPAIPANVYKGWLVYIHLMYIPPILMGGSIRPLIDARVLPALAETPNVGCVAHISYRE
jgi:hypothetical protein